MMDPITAGEVNRLLKFLIALSPGNGDRQLSLMLWALITACKGTNVEKARLKELLDECWQRPLELKPLAEIRDDA